MCSRGYTSFCLLAPVIAVFLFLSAYTSQPLHAQTIEDFRKSIQEKNDEIKKLETEANQYRQGITVTQKLGKSLKEELARINQQINILRKDIIITEKRIKKTELEVSGLTKEIVEKETSITKSRSGLAGLIQTVSQLDRHSILLAFFQNGFLSEFFRQFDYAEQVQGKIIATIGLLHSLAEELKLKKAAAEEKRVELKTLGTTLKGQRQATETIRSERDILLKETKNQEQKYRALLSDREKEQTALEDEIRAIEAKIRITIDPNSLPTKGSGILAWPLPNATKSICAKSNSPEENCVTQLFGYTSFAAIGSYGGRGHNGVDFRATPGTSVLATTDGTVVGVGDTDLSCRKVSYGKWVLIRHANGLSTLYAHLSAISVAQGVSVTRGQSIALSGSSGYATGPHLHLSAFATQAVTIESIRSKICGTLLRIPISAINGYLDPLDYL